MTGNARPNAGLRQRQTSDKRGRLTEWCGASPRLVRVVLMLLLQRYLIIERNETPSPTKTTPCVLWTTETGTPNASDLPTGDGPKEKQDRRGNDCGTQSRKVHSSCCSVRVPCARLSAVVRTLAGKKKGLTTTERSNNKSIVLFVYGCCR